MTGYTVHVVGSVNEDLRLRVAGPPVPGETVIAREAVTELGGKGANQAIAARRAGGSVRFVGAVGDDVTGVDLRDGLAAEGIDVSALVSVPGRLTGRAIVTVSDAGENQIIVVGGANASVTAERVDTELDAVRPGDPVVLQLELPLPVVAAAAARARRRDGFVMLNAAPVDVAVLPILADVDLLVVNAPELATLSDAAGIAGSDPARAVHRLADRFDIDVLCTFGGDGSLLVADGRTVEQNAYRVDVVDTTGAGDTFIGYLAAARAAGRSWPDALRIATAAASVTVTRDGAARAIPVADELESITDHPQSVLKGES